MMPGGAIWNAVRGYVYHISNLENGFKANTFLAYIAFCSIPSFLGDISDAAECFDILFLEPNFVTINTQLPSIS